MASSNITEYCACHANWLLKLSQKFLENSWNVIYNARPIREWSEQDPTMIRAEPENETVTPQPASQARLLFALATSIFYWKIQHFALGLSFQISPNTAPATQSDCHDWSLSQMKRYLQCAEQQVSSSNITEYCACHAKWLSWLILVTYETLFTTRGTTDGILQHHQRPRLPYKRSYSLTNRFSNASNLLRISSQTNLIAYESLLKQILTNLFSNESNLLRISSHANLISYESLLKQISSQTNLIPYESLLTCTNLISYESLLTRI